MKINKGFKIILYPTEKQKHKIHQFMNARIKSWNFGLEVQRKRLNKEEKLLSLSELKNKFNKELKVNKELEWVQEEGVPFHLFHFSLRDLNTSRV